MSDERDYPEPERPVASIEPAELARRLRAGEPVHLLDTRNRDEIDQWHIDAPRRTEVPYMRFQAAEVTDTVGELFEDPGGEVVVVCAEGAASAYVAGLLQEEGVDAVNLAGGMYGWARLYERYRLSDDPLVVQYARPSSGCLAYLLVSGEEAAVIDPLRAFAGRYVEDAREHGAVLSYALDTHVHADHVSGLRELAAGGVGPVLPELAVERGYADPVRTVADGGTVVVGDTAVEVVAAPGHTTGMTAYRVGDLLLTGDGLFLRRVPRPDLQAGDDDAPAYARELYHTLTERFARFEDDLRVAPGHFDPSDGTAGPFVATLGELRERLPVFGESEDAFVERITGAMGPQPANYREIIDVNLGVESADEGTAFELELGPNNCAAGAAAD
jgi:glyoxylase-like metal-dependent hydrolase (beta-lactamase superfamily II)